ncbi:MAG TPA: hypothetical protein VIU33_07935 [Nitrospiria bacterium]
MKPVVQVIAIFVLLSTPAGAWAIEGFSGSFWGIGIYETQEENRQTLGSIRQGIDWFKVYDLKVSTYAKFRYRFEDEDGGEFFNAFGPALGASIGAHGVRLGVEYQKERFPNRDGGITKRDTDIYLEWYFGWDLKNLKK